MPQECRSFVPGRKGKKSVADCLIHALMPAHEIDNHVLSKSIGDLRTICSLVLSFEVESSTIRSTLYRHPEIFQRDDRQNAAVQYRLSSEFLKRQHEK